MNPKNIKELFERIKRHYPMFTYDDEKLKEWHRFLKEYDANDILNSFDRYLLEQHEQQPLMTQLTRGLSKIETEEEKLVYLQCDLCKEKILVGNDFNVFEKHHRRCSKIDFIDRQAKELKGEGIDKQHFYEMSDDELDSKYRKWMDNWSKTHSNIALGTILKTL